MRAAVALLVSGPLLLMGCRSVAATDELPITPYSAEEIREECRPGTRLVFLITPPGGAAGTQEMTFLAGDAEAARVRVVMPAGSDGAPTEASANWEELRDHGAFDLEETTRVRETVTVSAGTFDCRHYVVPVEGAREHYWFALEKPGPPLLLEVRSQGEIQSRMEILEYDRPASR